MALRSRSDPLATRTTDRRPHGDRRTLGIRSPVAHLTASLLLAAVIGCPPTHKLLSVTPHPQETSMWCWAGSGQMAMHFLGTNVAQCTQANNRFGVTNCPCTQCTNPQVNPPCVMGGWPEFGKYGFTFLKTSSAALTWSQLTGEVNNNRPVAFSWGWNGGGGHMMVAIGYATANGVQYVTIHDPWSPCTGDTRTITYSEYVSVAGHHTHWDDFYNLAH